jgi:predicted GNAT superfamily acetyltransferase
LAAISDTAAMAIGKTTIETTSGLRPERFGFRRHGAGWLRGGANGTPVAFASLAWPQAQAPSYVRDEAGEPDPTDALNLIVRLQGETWGMPPEEVVPANILAVLRDGGGSVLAAYRPGVGFNADGWLGFAIALGGRNGVLVSHMLGVREDARGAGGIGWSLKALQGCLAAAAGHHAAVWTFDPMRGANARLNIEKLGATVSELTLDKYGVLRSSLYGDVPSDRFTAHWGLRSPRTAARLVAVAADRLDRADADALAAIPEATPDTAARLAADHATAVWYRIPADIDALMQADPAAAVAWRGEMRAVLGHFLIVARAEPGPDAATDPAAVVARVAPGDYVITRFVSFADEAGERVNAYVLERRPLCSREES